MALASVPMVVQLTQKIFEGLSTIGDDESKWRTKPKTVQIGIGPELVKLPMPALAVECSTIETTPWQMATANNVGAFEELYTFEIACLTAGGSEAYTEVHKLIADVRQWLRENFRGLGGLVDSGYMFDSGYKSGIQAVQGGMGIGMGTVVVQCRLITSTSTP